MIHEHGWTLTELEGMSPLERDIYISLLRNHIAEQEEKARNRAPTPF